MPLFGGIDSGLVRGSGREATRAEDAQGTTTQSHISPSIEVSEENPPFFIYFSRTTSFGPGVEMEGGRGPEDATPCKTTLVIVHRVVSGVGGYNSVKDDRSYYTHGGESPRGALGRDDAAFRARQVKDSSGRAREVADSSGRARQDYGLAWESFSGYGLVRQSLTSFSGYGLLVETWSDDGLVRQSSSGYVLVRESS